MKNTKVTQRNGFDVLRSYLSAQNLHIRQVLGTPKVHLDVMGQQQSRDLDRRAGTSQTG
jgi:hypothetical protein